MQQILLPRDTVQPFLDPEDDGESDQGQAMNIGTELFGIEKAYRWLDINFSLSAS